MPNRWRMGVQECSHCGASLRFGDDAHQCGSRNTHIKFNLATTDQQKALLSEAVRKVWGIYEDRWYAQRPHYREFVKRHRTEQRGVVYMSRVLVIADTHCPGMRTGYVDFLKRVADSCSITRVVHIGDLVDRASISYHEKSSSLRNASLEYPLVIEPRKRIELDGLSRPSNSIGSGSQTAWKGRLTQWAVCVRSASAAPVTKATRSAVARGCARTAGRRPVQPPGGRALRHCRIPGRSSLLTRRTGDAADLVTLPVPIDRSALWRVGELLVRLRNPAFQPRSGDPRDCLAKQAIWFVESPPLFNEILMHPHLPPSPLPPNERQAEIARILSRAFLRLRQRGCCDTDGLPGIDPDSRPTCLEVRARSRPTVPAG